MKEAFKILVLMKQVADPEGPPTSFQVDQEKNMVVPKGIPPVLSPFDKNALEAGLRIAESLPGSSELTVLSMGRALSKNLFLEVLAAGADRAVLLQDSSIDAFDVFGVVHLMTAAIKKMGKFDLILCGRESADANNGQVGIGIASLLGIPAISIVQKISVKDDKVILEKPLSEGYGVFEGGFPLLATISGEAYEFRRVSIPAIMKAKKKPILFWKSEDLGVDMSEKKGIKLRSLTKRVSGKVCEFISGDTGEKIGRKLALKLIESNVL